MKLLGRVLHIINGEHYSGAERLQDLLALRLPEHGFEVGFVAIRPMHFSSRRQSQVMLIDLPMRSKCDLSISGRIAAIAREGKYRLIHTHTPRAALVGRIAAGMAKLPLVHHVHSPARLDTPYRLRNWLNATSERISVGNAAALIAVSEKLKGYLHKEGFDSQRIHMVANGVPVRGELPERHEPQGRPWTIGMMALFRPRKGLEVLLDTLALLREQGTCARLYAVGPFESPAYEAHIHQRVKALGLEEMIEWAGYRADAHAEFARMDMFVLPSLYGEGLPMVVLEAMAAGVPVVASDVDGITQAIRHGVDGVLFAPGDASALAQAIRTLVEGEISAEALRASAYARQRAEFSDERMAQSVADVYRKVLA